MTIGGPSADQSAPEASHATSVTWAELSARGAGGPSLTALATVDPGSLTGADLVDAVVASEKALSLLTGVQIRLLTALAVPFMAGDPMRLATRLARRNRTGGDPTAEQIQLLVPDAAATLAAAEIAAALRISPVTAGIRVRDAGAMTTTLAPTLEALEEGRLDRGKVRVIAEQCEPLSEEHTAQVQGLVLPRAEEVTTSELRDITGQAVITVDPDGAENRHRAAAVRRDLTLSALPDAMATLKAFLPADGAVKIFQISDLMATGTAGVPDDPRGIGARRVDALVDIADQLLTYGRLDLSSYLGHPLADDDARDEVAPSDPGPPSADPAGPTGTATPAGTPRPASPTGSSTATGTATPADHPAPTDEAASDDVTEPTEPTDSASPGGSGSPVMSGKSTQRARRTLTRQGRRPHLSVTMGLGTLAGLDDLPATLAGFGAIPAGLGRSIAASAATITAQLTDSATGVITNAGSLTYRPRQDLRDQIAALLNICQFPSCRQPVWRCDIDHRDPFDHQHPESGGPTAVENVGPFCRRHHLLKHHTAWRLRPDPHRYVLHWTSPTGHSYTKRRTQAVPPIMWFTSTATAVAERLDHITATTANPEVEDAAAPLAPSITEEVLTTLLLRYSINQQPMEYEPVAGAWHTMDTTGTVLGAGTDQYGTTGNQRDDDPPPF